MEDREELLIEYALHGTFIRFFPYIGCLLAIIIVGILLDGINKFLMNSIMGLLLVLPFIYSYLRPLLIKSELDKDYLIKTYKLIKKKSSEENRFYYNFIIFNLEYELRDCLKLNLNNI